MANCTVGAGVLSLPFAFQATGLVGGLLLCTVVAVIEGLTMYVLSKFAERYRAHSYVELVRRALGRKLSLLLSGVLVVAMFGACVAYLIILGDNLTSLAAAAGLPALVANRQHIVGFLGLCVMLPMCLPKNLGALAAMNQIAVLGFLVGAAMVSFRGMQIALQRPDLMAGVRLFEMDYDSLFAIPIVVFGFNCHAMVVSIFQELEPAPGLLLPAVLPSSPSAFRRWRYLPRPDSRKLVGMLGVIMSSTSLVLLAYAIVGITGYLAFPGYVSSNILVSFPQDDPLVQVARGTISLIILGSYPLTHHPARAGFQHLVRPRAASAAAVTAPSPLSEPLLEASQDPSVGVSPYVSIGFTLAFVLGSTAVAEVVTDLGFVLHLLGGLCITFIIFFLPGLLLINAAILKYARTVLSEVEGEADAYAAAAADSDGPREGVLIRMPSLNGRELTQPLLTKLQTAREKGIKKGLIYAPRLSWLFGITLLVISVLVAGVTLTTVILGD
ncbi:hypothetical protein CHLRE_06g264450v5 [Chlamydomonas reinhardtii]|uniref:Amino acid transporter transmembrane domain-containing protein n=1 Tax=Chlamydomonas reinhardtii TaxID=3055 RepID=A0A2K3DMY8_CHLRE|nr:uncharacterized protein CHLRE_06g264450v5 [Chlamydomonas reinhardtii]PNW81882.1 hypothetical protein CHLRE_06g264450v5 [Chlamydomonas reinhardtii]